MKQKLFLIVIAFPVVLALQSQSFAQEFTRGEFSQVMICPFECKPGTPVRGVGTWNEVTTLMLFNMDNTTPDGTLVFLDGNQKAIAQVVGDFFSGFDLDEINVCRTLEAGDIPVPEAGIVAVLSDVAGSDKGLVYGWAKNYLGKFRMSQNEPFDGNVKGIAKTECRIVPEARVLSDIVEKAEDDEAPSISPVLVEKTEDPE